MVNDEDRWLSGDKEIALYLNASVSTVRRWRRTAGMPVVVAPGSRQPRTTRGALDAWLFHVPPRSPGRPRKCEHL